MNKDGNNDKEGREERKRDGLEEVRKEGRKEGRQEGRKKIGNKALFLLSCLPAFLI
jgi:flagellar biosynthesis/type III secretory pathway protein FliH